MKHLTELAEIITKNKLKKIDILGLTSNRESNIHQLYEGIVSGEMREEEVAKEKSDAEVVSLDSFRK